MLKQTIKNEDQLSKEVQEDIQFLLSNIRSRENGLIFFLERFTSQCQTQEQYITFKEQFLQKQKIYSNQVSRIIYRYSQDKASQQQAKQYIRTFWIKVKSIIKVSLDRLRMLQLLNEKIFCRYEQIIELINKNYNQQKELQEFNCIQNLLKKRNVDALIYSRNHFTSPNSDGKITKNRSQSAFKHSKYSPKLENIFALPYQKQTDNQVVQLYFQDEHKNPQNRMKSLNRYRKKKILLQSKNISSKATDKKYKKINKNIEKYQKCLEDVMDCVIDFSPDKKKNIKQNQDYLYDQLFNKNIPNHKMISKFLFGACGIAQLLVKRKNLKTKKVLVAKIEKNIRENKDIQKKNKSKQQKQDKQKDKQKQKVKEKDKDNQRQKQKEKQKEKEKQKDKMKQKQKKQQIKQKQRPQSCLTAQIRGIFQQQKRKMIQTTLILQDKKNNKYRRKIGARIQKYTRLIKLIT